MISMNNIDVLAIQTRIEAVLPALNEYQRRRYLSAEAKSIGHGGISLISRISGMSRQTLTVGVKELDGAGGVMPEGRNRRPGGGRKPVRETQAGILDTLEELVSAHTKGDPMTTLRWANKSLRNLEKGLAEKGYKASYRVVGEMLKMLGYGLQGDKKTLTITKSHADRDAQFE
jgi:DNA-binding transcriptional ArsR family regulator